jgi:hypothetical protein
MTALAKRKQSLLPDAMVVAETAVLASAAREQRVSAVVTVSPTGVPEAMHVKAAISAKNADRVWAMRLSAPSARPWSVQKCRCANWPRKPMAKPSHA